MVKLCDIGRWFLGSDGDEYCYCPPTYSNLIAPGIRQAISLWYEHRHDLEYETPSVLIPTINWSDGHNYDWRNEQTTLEFWDEFDSRSAVIKISNGYGTNTVELPMDLFLNDDYGGIKRRVLAGIPR